MILRLVWQSIRFAPGRSLFMLAGYALGVGVMVALLSIGDALVEQSRDRDLVGGGDLAVLPAGIDLETLRTGGVSSLYFRIALAPYFYREVLAGPRLAGQVERAAPWIDDQLVYVRTREGVVPASAGGLIPSASEAVGAAPEVLTGTWADNAADARWLAPDTRERLVEIDAFHPLPAAARGDSTWAEWHYFNVLSPGGDSWVYLTFLLGGDVSAGQSGEGRGGQVLGTLVPARGPGRTYRQYVSGGDVRWGPGEVDLALGEAFVELDSAGEYRVRARIRGEEHDDTLTVDFVIRPQPRRYLPALDVSPGGFPSGYAVPVLRGDAEGSVCSRGKCEDWTGGRAYHDHNWGTWRDVTWDWGQFQIEGWSILYGGVQGGAPDASRPPARFLFAVDSLGLAAVLPIRSITYEWSGSSPSTMKIEAERGDARLQITARVEHVQASRRDPRASEGDVFFQMHGPVILTGDLDGRTVEATGTGFFETWKRE